MGDTLFENFLFLTDSLPFILPITFVPSDVLELFVVVDMLLAHEVGCIPDDLFAQTYLTRYLDSKRATGLSDGELEERTHSASVIEHSAVDDTGGLLRKMLEVRIVCRDDTEDAALHQLAQDSFRDRSA